MELEELRREVGTVPLAKLDQVLTRDALYQRRQEKLDKLLGVTSDARRDHANIRALVNLRTGRSSRAERGAQARKDGDRRKRAFRERGEKAAKGLAASVRRLGGKVDKTLWLSHSVVTRLTARQLVEVAARGEVSTISHNKQVFALAMDVSRPLIGADFVETSLGYSGLDVPIGLLDTGVDSAHTALANAVAGQFDFTGEGTGDLHGHGTHTAGTIGSRDATYRGVAPGCSLFDFKMMNASGSTDAATAVTAIQAGVAQGMRVLSNSWGFSHANGNWVCNAGECVLCTAADNAMIAGVTFVVAAGNEDEDTCRTYDTHIRCPGHSVRALTVGASDDSDNMASFSSTGPTVDGRQKPDVTAPGVDIMSCERGTNGFVEMSGTSMACPHVAGLCALMIEKNPGLSAENQKRIIMQTAIDIGADPDLMGEGRVDAVAAVYAA
jgi:subtilisin family serine protease